MKKIFNLLVIIIFFISLINISSAGYPIITNFKVVPNTAINETNPGILSAEVTDSDLKKVAFVVIDSNNNVGTGSTILFGYQNHSGVSGLYSDWWRGRYWMVSNGIVNTLVTRIIISPCPSCQYEIVSLGRFKKNSASIEKSVVVWYNRNSERILKLTEDISGGVGPLVEIEPGISTLRFGTLQIPDWGQDPVFSYSNNQYTLYEIGNLNNPSFIWGIAPCGKYLAGIHVSDKQNMKSGAQPIEIDTIPESGSCNTCAGDLTGDKTIGFKDFTMFASFYGILGGNPNFNAKADMNTDLSIDFRDFTMFAYVYGTTCSS